MSTIKLNYAEYPYGEYFISEEEVILPKRESVKLLAVSIDGWANRRYLYIDEEQKVTYFQASAEGTDCHRCGICQKRMQLIGYRTGHHFVKINGNASLYQKRSGLPKSYSSDDVGPYLGLAVTSVR